MLKRGIEGDLASRLDYQEKDFEDLKSGKEDADAIEETRKMTASISVMIDDVFESKDAKQRYNQELDKARQKGMTQLEFLKDEIEQMEKCLADYKDLFKTGDTRVWNKKTIESFLEWAEQYNPTELRNKAIGEWREKEYLPRLAVLRQYDAFPDEMKSKGEFKDFFELGGTKRKEMVGKMIGLQQKEFSKLIEKSSFSELDKKAAVRQFDAAYEDIHNPDEAYRGIEQRTYLLQQLPDQIKSSDKQQKEFTAVLKKIGKYANGNEEKFAEHFEEQRFMERGESVMAANEMLKYCEKLEQKFKEGVLSEKTYKDFVDWAIDTGCKTGMRGMEMAHRGFHAEMAGREKLKSNFDHYLKQAEGLVDKNDLKQLEKDFYDKEAGNTERTAAFFKLRSRYEQLSDSLGVNESMNHNVNNFAKAADDLFNSAVAIEDVSARNQMLEIAKGSYEKIGEFAKENGDAALAKHVEDQLKTIDGMLNGKGAEGVESTALTAEMKEQLGFALAEMMGSNKDDQQELLRIQLMDGVLNHMHKEALEAGEDSHEKRSISELTEEHHKRLHEGLQERTKGNEADKEMMLNQEGKAQKVVKVDIARWGEDDPNKTFQSEAEAMREQLNLGNDSEMDTSQFKFKNDKGEEMKYEEAREALSKRTNKVADRFAGKLADNKRVKDLYPKIGEPEKLKGVLAEHLATMISDGSVGVDLDKVQAAS